jgi:molybdate transport system permease protein
MIHLPLVLPPVVTGYLLLLLLGRNGVIGRLLHDYLGITLAFNWKGAVLAAAVMSFPLLVRAVRLSVDNVDQGLEAAARTLGAGPVRVFFTVTLPLMVPGIITGTILAFARSLGEFGATITFVSNIRGQTQTLPLALYTLTQVPDGELGAMRLCLLSVLIAMVALMCSEMLARRFTARMKG